MSEENEQNISPTVSKVLDEYLTALLGDEDIDDEAAKRLDALLRLGKIPKIEEIDIALSVTKFAEKA